MRKRAGPVVDPASVADAVGRVVAGLEAPLPLSTLGTLVRRGGVPLGNPALREVLDRLVASGAAFEHPVGRTAANPSPRYWRRPASVFVLETLRGALARQPEWTPAQLRKLVPQAYHELVEEQVGALLATGALHPAPARGRSQKFRTAPPRPTGALTAAQLQSLRKLVGRVNELRRPALAFDDLLALLDGVDAAAAAATPAAPRPQAEPPTEAMLLRWYAEDLPRRDGLRSMPIPWTWRRYQAHCSNSGRTPDAAALAALLRSLHAAGRISLTVHDAPVSIPDTERALLPAREDGRPFYYWTPIDAAR
ncbi:MAG: hypothetical protein KJ067_14490 [Vicinamibacteria bacterium]|nr:hypothetical protein [Vicinamibacteria bacterium]